MPTNEEVEDELFQEALEKCGITLEELQAKTFDEFLDGANGDEAIATKRFSHYESSRGKKLYLVQQQMTILQAKRSPQRNGSAGTKSQPTKPEGAPTYGLTLCIRRRMVIDKEREREEQARRRVEQQRAELDRKTAEEIEKLRLQREQEAALRDALHQENVRQAVLRQQREQKEREQLREKREIEMLQEEKSAQLEEHLAKIEERRAKRREALAKVQEGEASARRQERYLRKKAELERVQSERLQEVERLEAERAREAEVQALLRQDQLSRQCAKEKAAEEAALKRAKEIREKKFQAGLERVKATDEKASLAVTTQREKLMMASRELQKELESSLDSARRRRLENAVSVEQRRREIAETNEIRRQVRLEESARKHQLREEDLNAKMQAVHEAKVRISKSNAAKAQEIAHARQERLEAAESRRHLMLEALYTPTR